MLNKIAFYGAGNVGATAAHWLAEMEVGDCVLFDIFGEVAAGKALDLFEAGPPMGFDTQISGSSDPSVIEGADVIVVTAGVPRRKDPETGKFPSRDELVKINQGVMTVVSENIKKYAPDSIIVIVTNPLDAMCHVAKEVTGFPRERIIGQAGALDTALMSEEKLDAIISRTAKGGGEIVGLLGYSGFYAPAAGVAIMVESILKDKKRVIPCAVYTEGEYGYQDLFIGLPVVLGRGGIEQIVPMELNDKERAMLDHSAEAVRTVVKVLGF